MSSAAAFNFLYTVPVLPSANIARDVQWYATHFGTQVYFADEMYAVLFRQQLWLHLQWHADTPDDPLLGGSVVRIVVDRVQPVFEELVSRGTLAPESLRRHTPWHTHECGFFDLNRNAIFLVEIVPANHGEDK